MKKKNTTRIIAIVLVLLMALALIPIAASAEAGDYTVYYKANDGNSDVLESDVWTEDTWTDGNNNLSEAPAKTFFTFSGWATTAGSSTVEYIDKAAIPKDAFAETSEGSGEYALTLYAIYAQNKVSVTYSPGVHSTATADIPDTPAKDAGSEYQLKPADTFGAAEHYRFLNWTYNGDTYDAGYTITLPDVESVVFTAQWQEQYTVTYALNGGSGTAPAQTVDADQSVTLPAKPTREGFTFIGWKVGDTSEVLDKDATSYKPEGDVTLTAQWADTVMITYEPNGGTGSMSPNPDSTLRDSDYTIASSGFSQSGKAFSRWLDTGASPAKAYEPGDPLDWTSVGERNAVTLTAQWLDLRTVTFNVNCEGATVTPTSVQVADGAKIGSGCSGGELPVPTSADYNFIEWNANSSGTGSTVTKDTTVSGANMQVYGKWISKTIPVTFDLDGGTPAMEPAAAERGADYTLPECTATKTGCVFAGWTIGTSDLLQPGETYAVGATSPNSLTVTANWKNEAVTVKYDNNGGTGSKTQNMSRASAAPLMAFSSTGIAKNGSVFLGWVTATAHTTPDFADEASVKWDDPSDPKTAVPDTPGDEVTLYALWESRLTGTVTIDNTTPKVGDTLTATPNVTPASENLYYRWKVNGKVVTGANAQTFEVPPDAYGYKITVEVTNDSNFAYVIASAPTDDVAANPESLTTITVAFAKKTDDVDYTGYVVKVNGSEVHDGQNDIKVPKKSTVVVTLESGTNTSAYVSKLQLGTITLEGSNVAAVNNIKAPDDATCTLTVTFAKKEGTTKTATIDPNADASATTALIAAKAQATLPAGQKDRYKANAFNVVPCWDNQVTNTLKIPAEIPDEGLSFTLPYPAGSDVNATIAANMPACYNITVYHRDGSTVKEITNFTANKAFAAGVTVTGQKDFSDFGVSVTPKALDGSITLTPNSAYVGTAIKAAYSKSTYGTLQYQWQTKGTSDTDWTNVGTGQTYTPKKADKDRSLRCVVTSSFETGSVASKTLTVAAIPNPVRKQDVINNGNTNYAFAQPGLIGNLSDEMEYNIYPSSSKPDADDGGWRAVKTGSTTSDKLTEGGTYWVRFKDEPDTAKYRSVAIESYYTVTATPDSVSVNRLYFTASGSYTELIEGRVWLVPAGKSINVSANSANTNYYKITQVRYENLDTGKYTTRTINKANTGSTGSFTVSAPFWVQASAGVYGSKTGDTSHLELWVELAALSMMGLGAALVIGRKKLKEQK